MTTSVEVCGAIAEVVAGVWPDRMIYRDFCPADHKRPSSYLYVTESGFEPVNPFLVQWEMEAVLELYCATDEYDISSTEELRRDQESVLLAFGTPALKVGDRYITLTAKGDGMEMGSAFVRFSATWVDSRPEYQDPNAPDSGIPRMEDFAVNGAVLAGGAPEKGDGE